MPAQRGMTLTQHIHEQEKLKPEARGAFTKLINELVVAAKIISREVNQAGLAESMGYTGDVNIQGEEVQKLDQFANNLICRRLERCGVLCGMASEEVADIMEIPERFDTGDYLLLFDPLDGSSNIDVNISIGTIFSVIRKCSDGNAPLTSDFLQRGNEQVAAGYFLYGSSTMLVYTTGNGANGFTLDPSVGEFFLSHPNIQTPERAKVYSVNEGNWNYWSEGVRGYIDYLKGTKNAIGKAYSSRYVGSLVADFHRNLLKGGIFMYPSDTKDPKKAFGKLRYLYECAPLAFVVEQAGGYASTGEGRLLDFEPQSIHQRVPIYIGSKLDVLEAEEFVQGKR
ncbi:MAG: class 1 fructose-bisphosphatase [Deltaproteobacteria bacterium]|nr:class 1 fructose-bisphosphatase [Deltaproteobacteria bacterium]